MLRKRVLPILRKSGSGMAEVARRPLKLIELFGGAAILTLAYIAALVFSVHAFGATDVSVASIGVVFLVGSAISSAAPTPGGIGAVEAALIAGLTAVGLDRDDRRARRVPVPHRDVLAADPAGLAGVRAAAAAR